MRVTVLTPARATLAAGAPLAATAVGVFAEGGYAQGARVAFGASAFAALAVTIWAARGARALREPLVRVLAVLAALGAVSTAWTVGLTGETLVWGLVTAGYAAVLVASATAAALPGGVLRLAAGVTVIVVIASVLGLASAALADPAFASRIAGTWRPSGPFEYPPALALAQAFALPALLSAASGERRVLAAAGAAGIVVAAGVLALSASRTGLAIGLVTAGAWILRPPRGVRRAGPIALLAAAAAAGAVMATAAHSGDAVRIAVGAGAVGFAAAGWPAARRWWAPRPERDAPPIARSALAAGAVVTLAALAGALAFGTAAGRGAGPASGFLHGRGHLWRAALDTFADRPGTGAGADAFLAASARHQGGQSIAFAHDLPLELAAELGLVGLALALALYAANLRLLVRAAGHSSRRWLLAGSFAFLASNLVDWPWHLAGAGALWAVATGACSGEARRSAD